MNRREFIYAGSMVSLSMCLAFGARAQSTGKVLTREDIRTFSKNPAKVSELRRAVSAIQARGFGDATSWFNMAAIHEIDAGDPDAGNVPPTIRALWGQCHIDDSLFFLWHRAYVWSMEKLMQDAVKNPDFRLPYWDWYSDPALPAIFRSEFEDVGRTVKNSLYVANRNARANNGSAVWNPQISTEFTETSFDAFQDRLNFGEHGAIHVAVGTRSNMGNTTTAARDPVFWLHHANIDRLLPVWLKINVGHARMPSGFPTWNPAVYRFPVSAGGVVTPAINDLALASPAAMMGYQYENTSPPSLPRPSLPMRPAVVSNAKIEARIMSNGVKSIAASKSVEISGGGTIVVPLGTSHGKGIQALGAGEKVKELTTVNVVLENVSVQDIPEGVLSYRAFLNLPNTSKPLTRFEDHFIGSVSLFALGHQSGGHADHKPKQIRFPVAEKLARIFKGALAAPSQLQISLLPVLAPEATEPKRTVLKIGEIRVETSSAPLM